MNFIYELEKYVIMVLGLILFILEIGMFFKYCKFFKKILLAIIGLYWSLFMAYCLFNPHLNVEFKDSQFFFSSGILFTLAVLVARAIDRWRYLDNV